MRILVIDDEVPTLKMFGLLLEALGHVPLAAESGEEGLLRFDRERPDVVLTDIKMPGIDGMEVLRRVKKAYPQVQVIVLTGHGTEKDEEEARRLGAFEYHKKPVDIDILVRDIRRAFREKVEDAMVAATFAQAGEFDNAREILDEDKK